MAVVEGVVEEEVVEVVVACVHARQGLGRGRKYFQMSAAGRNMRGGGGGTVQWPVRDIVKPKPRIVKPKPKTHLVHEHVDLELHDGLDGLALLGQGVAPALQPCRTLR